MTDAIRCWIIRGGTSKGVYLKESDLPRDPAARDATILGIFGSPDKRQIDGLGGADPLTSKVCVVGPPPDAHRDCHLTYTFGQVEIDQPHVDYHSLCGNLTAGVAAFAIWENMARPVEPMTEVRIYNTNLDAVIVAEVPVRDGRPLERGEYAMPGVPGTGAKITLNMAGTAGGTTGSLLPTGDAVTRLDVEGVGPIDATLIDVGNASVFIRAADVGLKGTETAAEIDADKALAQKLERIRSAAAHAMGMINDPADATAKTPATPILGMFAPAADYRNVLGGGMVRAGEVDFCARLMFMQQMHKTYAGTSTVATGVAAKIPGSIVHEMATPASRERPETRIGHPAGMIETESIVVPDGNGYRVARATLGRTARRIMEGYVFPPER